MKKLLLFIWIFCSYSTHASNNCLISEKAQLKLSKNEYDTIDVKELFTKMSLSKGDFNGLKSIYIPNNDYEYLLDEDMESNRSYHIFKARDYILYYSEVSSNILSDLRGISRKETSLFSLILESYQKLKIKNVDVCDDLMSNHYFAFTNYFTHGQSEAFKYGVTEDVIVEFKDKQHQFFMFLIPHLNKDKMWVVRVEQKK